MKEYGTQRSTVKPLELELTETKVFVNSDIVQVNEPGTDEQPGFTGYEFTLTEYEKDEYIKLQAEKNESLGKQVTDTQVALTEVYEMILVQKGVGIMAKVYADLIKKGIKTIDQVPERLREEVKKILEGVE